MNDVPKANQTNKNYSLLFADDLLTFFIYKRMGKIDLEINKYLKDLEPWLCRWKMKISPTKCSYTIFSKRIRDSVRIKLKMFDEMIPYAKTIKFLGILELRYTNTF